LKTWNKIFTYWKKIKKLKIVSQLYQELHVKPCWVQKFKRTNLTKFYSMWIFKKIQICVGVELAWWEKKKHSIYTYTCDNYKCELMKRQMRIVIFASNFHMFESIVHLMNCHPKGRLMKPKATLPFKPAPTYAYYKYLRY
jgi:hypothetical protein